MIFSVSGCVSDFRSDRDCSVRISRGGRTNDETRSIPLYRQRLHSALIFHKCKYTLRRVNILDVKRASLPGVRALFVQMNAQIYAQLLIKAGP